MTTRLKVPALSLALALALAACGEPPDSDGERLDTEAAEHQDTLDTRPPPADAGTDPQVTTPAAPPATGRQAPPPPPVQDTRDPATPPAREGVVEERPEEPAPTAGSTDQEWEQIEDSRNALPAGTLVSARIADAISTRTHAEGDVFRAQVTDDIRGGDGTVLIPAGTQLVGHVATARPSTDSDEEAVLVLAFDALVLNDREHPLRATVIDAEISGDAAATGTRTAATVATGAAAGAVLGRVLGRDTRSTVAGAAAGAVAGAGIALTTRDGHASIPGGSTLRLQLDDAFVVANP